MSLATLSCSVAFGLLTLSARLLRSSSRRLRVDAFSCSPGSWPPFATLAAVLYGYSSGAFDTSPFYLITYVGLYGLLLWLGDRVVPSLRRPISFCARHSFTVYMIHMMALIPLSAAVPKLYGVPSLVEHVGLSIVTIAICVLLSALLDTLLIKPLQRLFDILAQKLAK